ncbi:probable serine/threonine-protein kinase irlA [Hibiscus syriacus]|uniref:probable serine/threonine-protein kinase irlA n=1 Tax=Hibiscus syriacus TaxID=106335 RepID=UPI0019218748|nr:probable serine/threonine-protein kinase irlA [Hibiscus syriacus]
MTARGRRRSRVIQELDEATLYEVEIIQAPEEEPSDYDMDTEQEQQEEQREEQVPQPQQQQEKQVQQQPVDEVVPGENKGDEESLVLDDLPMICNYEEGRSFLNAGYGLRWHSCCEPWNEFWEPFGGVNFEPVWDDAPWDFKDGDETKHL